MAMNSNLGSYCTSITLSDFLTSTHIPPLEYIIVDDDYSDIIGS